jgi:hypothetical protein
MYGNARDTSWRLIPTSGKKQILRVIRGMPRRGVLLAKDETELLLFQPLRSTWSLRGQPAQVLLSGLECMPRGFRGYESLYRPSRVSRPYPSTRAGFSGIFGAGAFDGLLRRLSLINCRRASAPMGWPSVASIVSYCRSHRSSAPSPLDSRAGIVTGATAFGGQDVCARSGWRAQAQGRAPGLRRYCVCAESRVSVEGIASRTFRQCQRHSRAFSGMGAGRFF